MRHVCHRYKKAVTISAWFGTEESSVEIAEPGNKQLLVVPNPVKETAAVQFTTTTQTEYTLQLTDASGRVLQTQKGKSAAGLNRVYINVYSLVPGQYFLTMTGNNGEKQTTRLVKI